jgi:hypothetical protein
MPGGAIGVEWLEEMGPGETQGGSGHPRPPPQNPQRRGKGESAERKENRSFHLCPLVLFFFYLFANVQCNGLKPSRERLPPTQSCRGAELQQASHLPSVGHYPEPTPGQAAHHPPGVPLPPPHHPGTPDSHHPPHTQSFF